MLKGKRVQSSKDITLIIKFKDQSSKVKGQYSKLQRTLVIIFNAKTR